MVFVGKTVVVVVVVEFSVVVFVEFSVVVFVEFTVESP